jgi:hypothetical protein
MNPRDIDLGENREDFMQPHQAKLKTLWQPPSKGAPWSFFCPLCKIPRKLPTHPKPQPRHFLQIFLTAAFFTVLTWKIFNWKGLVSFIPFWVVFEVIYRSRMRVALVCKKCGFDPYLFLIDSNLAKREVDLHWRKKLEEKGIPYPEPKKKARKDPAGPLSGASGH